MNFFLFTSKILKFSTLVDIVAIDKLGFFKIKKNISRFSLQYNLLSYLDGSKIIINLTLNDENKIFSLDQIYKSANWCEREIWDLFGINFEGSRDLRRILTDYGFKGFPFRRDFPVVGFNELEYNNELEEIIYKDISLSQQNRFFTYENTWKVN